MPAPSSIATSWPIVDGVPTSMLVYCRLDSAQLPTPQNLVALTEQWIAQNVQAPLNTLMPPWLRVPMTKIGPAPKSGLPAEMLERQRANLPERDQQALFDQATHAIMIRSEGPCIPGMPGLMPCVAAAYACQERFGGLIVDIDTHSPMTSRPFSDLLTHDMLPRVHYFIDVTAIANANGGMDIVTTGMNRFGLPELKMSDVPRSIDEQCAKVVLGVAQVVTAMALQYRRETMSRQWSLSFPIELNLTNEYVRIANDGPVNAPSEGTGNQAAIRVELLPGQNAVLAVVPPVDWFGTPSAWANDVVSTFFPALPSTVQMRVHDDGMEAAHKRAVAELPDAKRRYLAGQTLPDLFLVKYPFPLGNGHHEYMWIAVRSWQGDTISGVLTNQPANRKDLSMGDPVTIDAGDVFDWMIAGPDGVLGGYTDPSIRGIGAAAAPRSTPANVDVPTDINPEVPEFVRRRRDRRFLDKVVPAGRAKAAQLCADFDRLPRTAFMGTPIFVLVLSLILSHWSVYFGIGILFSLVLIRQGLERRKRIGQVVAGLKDVAARGEFRIGMPIMFNTALREPGTSSAPALLLMMPDDETDPIPLFDRIMLAAAAKDPRYAAINQAFEDQRYVPHKRFRIPTEWTGGALVYGIGVMVSRDHWQSGVLDDPFFALLAGSGDTGGAMTLPWQLVQDALRG